MENLTVPRVLVSSLAAGAGKSFLTLGLIYELRRRGLSVSCTVLGNRMIQALLLRRASGRYTRSISTSLLSKSKQQGTLFQAGVGSDLLLIEGGRGIFDGESAYNLAGCDAEISNLAGLPILLLIDAAGFDAGLVPIVEGFMSFLAKHFPRCAGNPACFALNRVNPKLKPNSSIFEHYNKIFSEFSLSNFIGALPFQSGETRLPQDFVSEKTNFTLLPRQFLVDLGELVKNHIDIDMLIDVASQAKAVELPDYVHQPHGRRCRIAVSEDSCFVLGFQDNQDLFRYFGAEVVPFSPLADAVLPRKVGAVYLTGGFLSEYAEDLARNLEMKRTLMEFVKSGGVLVSEGAGTAYLCDEFSPSVEAGTHQGVGIIPALARASDGAPRYVEWTSVEDSVLGSQGLSLRGMMTGEWSLSRANKLLPVLRYDHNTNNPTADGWSPGPQIVSTFGFFHFGSNPSVARCVVDAAEVVCKLD